MTTTSTPLPPAPPGARRLTVTGADGTELNVRCWGSPDRPIVVLIHGWTLSLPFHHRLIEALLPRFQVIGYDQRGHGQSAPAGEQGYTTQALGDDLAAVLRAAIPAGRRAVLVGHSMGAMTIVAWAGRHPQQVHRYAAATLLASTGMEQLLIRNRAVPLPVPVARIMRPVTAAVFRAPLGTGRDDAVSRAMARRVALSRSATAEDVAVSTAVVQACPGPTRRGFATMLLDLDLTSALPSLGVPSLVLVGSQDRLTPPWHASRLARALPAGLGVVTVPRAGHMTPLTCVDVMTREIGALTERFLTTTADPAPADETPTDETPAGPAPAEQGA